jgi:hypothetical protein
MRVPDTHIMRLVRYVFGVGNLWRVLTVATCISFVTGCESEAQKLERLKTTAAVARLDVLRWQQAGQPDSVSAAESRADLAQRDLNRFMSGK